MENLLMIAKVVLVLSGIIAIVAALFLPVGLDIEYLGKSGEHILNYWMTCIELICIIAVYTYIPEWGSDASREALGALTLSVIVSWMLAVKRAKKLGITGVGIFIAVMAQIFSPLSIIIILVCIAGLANRRSGDGHKEKYKKEV